MFKVEEFTTDVVVESRTFLSEILQLLQPFVDQTTLMTLEILLRHVVKLRIEAGQECINARLEISRVAFGLDEHPVTHRRRLEPRSREHHIAKLLLGTQLVEPGFLRELSEQHKFRTEGSVREFANEEKVLDAVVDVIRVRE